jgi:hypothetical protein
MHIPINIGKHLLIYKEILLASCHELFAKRIYHRDIDNELHIENLTQ